MIQANIIIKKLTKTMGIESGLLLFEIQKQWAGMFDTNMNLHTYPSALNEGVLTIVVDSPIWLQEIRLHKKEIINRLSLPYIKDVKFKLGIIGSSREIVDRKDEKEHINTTPQNTPYWSLQLLQDVKDTELRDSLMRIITLVSQDKKETSIERL